MLRHVASQEVGVRVQVLWLIVAQQLSELVANVELYVLVFPPLVVRHRPFVVSVEARRVRRLPIATRYLAALAQQLAAALLLPLVAAAFRAAVAAVVEASPAVVASLAALAEAVASQEAVAAVVAAEAAEDAKVMYKVII